MSSTHRSLEYMMSVNDKLILSNHHIYAGTSVDEAREKLSRLFTEVTVEPLATSSPYSTLVNGLELPRSAVCYCEYHHGMVAGPKAPLDFHTIQLNLSGSAQFSIDGDITESDIKKGVMLSAGQQVKVRHTPDNSMLSFIVKDEVMRDVSTVVTGQPDLPALRFEPRFDPTAPCTASLLSLLQNFVTELNRPGSVFESPAALASFEHTLINFMLFGLGHNLSAILHQPSQGAGPKQVQLIEEYLTANAAQPIRMETLAEVTGHSVNSIYRAFRKHRNQTPMQFLRKVRMDRARSRLLRARTSDSVSSIAMECGFTHLGRFSVDYRRRFGEKPTDTLYHAIKTA